MAPIGCYALNETTSRNPQRIATDQELMARFHEIRDFWAERFSSLSMFAFESNRKLAETTKVPGFDQLKWEDTPNGRVFASNLVVTTDFHNKSHVDKDKSRYAYGIFACVDRKTGDPHVVEGASPQGRLEDAAFMSPKFGVEVSLDGCGTTELVWDSTVSSPISKLDTFTPLGEIIHAMADRKILHCSMSITPSHMLLMIKVER